MIDNDQQVNRIIRKVLGKSRKGCESSIALKYDSSNERTDSSYRNYQLQTQNSNLRKQLHKLQNLYQNKRRKQKVHQQIVWEIRQTQQKLKGILSQNQTLELSLCKMRTKNVDTKEEGCSRREEGRKEKEDSYKKQKRSRNKQITINPFVSQENQIKREDKQVQCSIDYMQKHKQNIANKKQYLEELEKIIQKQNKILSSYEKDIKEKSNVGKFAKPASHQKHITVTKNQSTGRIVKSKTFITSQ